MHARDNSNMVKKVKQNAAYQENDNGRIYLAAVLTLNRQNLPPSEEKKNGLTSVRLTAQPAQAYFNIEMSLKISLLMRYKTKPW